VIGAPKREIVTDEIECRIKSMNEPHERVVRESMMIDATLKQIAPNMSLVLSF
jgi:hypothetical protein